VCLLRVEGIFEIFFEVLELHVSLEFLVVESLFFENFKVLNDLFALFEYIFLEVVVFSSAQSINVRVGSKSSVN
jgi:hypothetical protein